MMKNMTLTDILLHIVSLPKQIVLKDNNDMTYVYNLHDGNVLNGIIFHDCLEVLSYYNIEWWSVDCSSNTLNLWGTHIRNE